MHSSNFESMARSMGTAHTRRGLLAAFAGGAAALFGASRPPVTVAEETSCCANCVVQHMSCNEGCLVAYRGFPGDYVRICTDRCADSARTCRGGCDPCYTDA
jgi:hypothetical protein